MVATERAGPHEPVVQFESVRFRWSPRQSFELAVDAFDLARGEKLLLLGPSGSGKSTVLSLLCGIVRPQQGRISVLGEDLSAMSNTRADRFRSEHFGIIFQMFNLLPYGTMADNVLLPLHFAPDRRRRAAEGGAISATAQRLLDRLGLDVADKGSLNASHLSVGQQQRVAAARALIGRPEIIVADEPTSSLDADRQDDFLDLLFDEVAASNATLLMVSHNAALGARFDRTLRLDEIARHVNGSDVPSEAVA